MLGQRWLTETLSSSKILKKKHIAMLGKFIVFVVTPKLNILKVVTELLQDKNGLSVN